MTPRRTRYAPTDESRNPHWLVTYDVYRRVLATTRLTVGTDLRAAMRQATEKCEADAWIVEKDGAYGFFSAIVTASAKKFAFSVQILLNWYRSITIR
jgi:predicted deacetylase